ncbi:uncharacterized protein TRIADDRAFT_55608 [Trichoplax adhaerens]|uniref:ATP-dependent RNA helicase n=1 Tax=Trichoplax adhaerens TaxID=10228 RepID=B3RVC9_TRIAD|nr:hypothetical protein TRIADDRAFT_55608 [Trichoplax adhaerens]EDV25480.1 hypothetical protein TRIADDRAFT_55608 [Trichoplax adhaerens]|eukprot:XP_002111513.1 hypothetical protein TRIADDRAFT_55608 [Trichoplax adhaerens]
MEGRNVIINSETGSGKTLCNYICNFFISCSSTGYLLPLINKLYSDYELGPIVPRALILAPTAELVHQISTVFRSLVPNNQFTASIVTSKSTLLIKDNTAAIIGVPHNITTYHAPSLLNSIETIIVDEADALVTGSASRDVWTMLNCKRLMVESKKADEEKQTKMTEVNVEISSSSKRIPNLRRGSSITRHGLDSKNCQYLFVGATLPSNNNEKSEYGIIHGWLKKLNPTLVHLARTENVHKIISTLQSDCIMTKNDEKLETLLHILDKVKSNYNDENKMTPNKNLNRSPVAKGDHLKMIVFTNTAYHAFALYRFLDGTDPNLMKEPQRSVLPLHFELLPPEQKEELINTVNFEKNYFKAQYSNEWKGRCGILHKDIPIEVREEILNKFINGDIPILITTDIASRGLDIPNVTAVIQYDFALSAVDYLHRAGRTARSGNEGQFFSMATENDSFLVEAIRNIKASESFDSVFSRNRNLRRKLRKLKKQQTDQNDIIDSDEPNSEAVNY